MYDEKQIEHLMKSLGITREEAIEVIEYDDDVQKNKKTKYDLTEEQLRNVQQMNRKRDHNSQNMTKRNRKPNELKEAIIDEIAHFLAKKAQGQSYELVEITNKNRMIHFVVGEKEFDLQLIEKRSPKK